MCSEYVLQYFLVERNFTLFKLPLKKTILVYTSGFIFLKLNLLSYLVCTGKRLEEIIAFPMNGARANH